MLTSATPAIITCLLFSFVWQWNDNVYISTYMSNVKTLMNALSALFNNIGYIMQYEFNPSYCATLFRMETGENIGVFIRNYRLMLAKNSLIQGDLVSATAAAVGFSDPYNFSNWFTKYVGISPSKYRKRYSMRESNKSV